MQPSLAPMKPSRLMFIVNPTAGKGRTLRVWEKLSGRLGRSDASYDVYLTTKKGDGERYVQQLSPDVYRTVISVGGDGTLNEIINGLAAKWLGEQGLSRIPFTLALLPTGSGNDFARTLEMPKDPDACLDCILSGKVRDIDLGKVGERYFASVSSAGFDAEVVDRFNRGSLGSLARGTLGYLIAVVATLASFKAERVELRLDETSISDKIMLVAVGNGRYYGGGMKITPDADVSDGKFDVCWVQDMSVASFLASLVSVFPGRHLNHPRVRSHRAHTVEVIGSSRLRVQVDGEIVSTLPALWTVVPRPIGVLVPISYASE